MNEPDFEDQAATSARAAPPMLKFPTRSITVVVARSPGTVAARLRHAVPGLDVIDLTDPGGASRAADASLIGHDTASTATGGLTVAERARPTAIIGDPDAWQSAWSLLGRLRPAATVVFDGCTLAQVRAVLHARVLPPATLPGHLLVCDQALEFSRARMPS